MYFVPSNNGFRRACAKCNGTGTYTRYTFNNNATSANAGQFAKFIEVCFRCDGRRVEPRAKWFATEAELAEHYAKLEMRKEAKYQRELAERRALAAINAEAEEAARVAREMELQAARDKQKFIDGELGSIVTVSGVVLSSFNITTGYGTSRLVKIQAGNAVVKFFSSANFAFGLDEGDFVEVYGELVSRELYEGNKETTIKKTKLVSVAA
jgi:hypothetical protein